MTYWLYRRSSVESVWPPVCRVILTLHTHLRSHWLMNWFILALHAYLRHTYELIHTASMYVILPLCMNGFILTSMYVSSSYWQVCMSQWMIHTDKYVCLNEWIHTCQYECMSQWMSQVARARERHTQYIHWDIHSYWQVCGARARERHTQYLRHTY